ncbi:MAG: hypothetical protein ABJJ53_04995 [Sulfitobacter sp.]
MQVPALDVLYLIVLVLTLFVFKRVLGCVVWAIQAWQCWEMLSLTDLARRAQLKNGIIFGEANII